MGVLKSKTDFGLICVYMDTLLGLPILEKTELGPSSGSAIVDGQVPQYNHYIPHK